MDTAERLERAFGRGRVQMATGNHVQVYREAAEPGERRRYTKRFLATPQGDFREWTEREWRILARLFGYGAGGVAEVVQFARGHPEGGSFVQTYDAGITIDQWLTLLPVSRDGRILAHVFEDCAHWWALAHHCLRALAGIHRLQLVHLDLKTDNVCLPADPPDFDPRLGGDFLRPDFERLALIDFAFALVAGEVLHRALPIGTGSNHRYQSPRLVEALEAGRGGNLQPMQALDWRCDLFSLAAMLERCLPHAQQRAANGWHAGRHQAAIEYIGALRACHDAPLPDPACHQRLLAVSAGFLAEPDIKGSLARGWQPAGLRMLGLQSAAQPTPLTRIAPPIEPAATAAAASLPRPDAQTAIATELHPDPAAGRSHRIAIAFVFVMAALAGLGAWYWTTHDDAGSVQTAAVDTAPPSAVEAPAQQEPSAIDAPVATDEPAPAATPPVEMEEAQSPLDEEDAALRPEVRLPPTRSSPGSDEAREAGARRAPETAAEAPQATRSEPPISRVIEPREEAERRARETVAKAPHAARSEPPIARSVEPREAPRLEPAIPGAPQPPAAAPDPDAPWLDPRAAEALQQLLPHAVRAVERRVAAVLTIAGDSDVPEQDYAVRNAAGRTIPRLSAPAAWRDDPQTARRLNSSAARAYWSNEDTARALQLQLRAFAADPLDPEIVGNLAFYQLRARPPDPERARQLALHALAVRGEAFPFGRIEDWTSLAVTSALLGRAADAERALFVVLALSPSLERSCRIALGSFTNYGRPLEGPARALLARVHARGRSNESSFCTWPPDWSAARQSP